MTTTNLSSSNFFHLLKKANTYNRAEPSLLKQIFKELANLIKTNDTSTIKNASTFISEIVEKNIVFVSDSKKNTKRDLSVSSAKSSEILKIAFLTYSFLPKPVFQKILFCFAENFFDLGELDKKLCKAGLSLIEQMGLESILKEVVSIDNISAEACKYSKVEFSVIALIHLSLRLELKSKKAATANFFESFDKKKPKIFSLISNVPIITVVQFEQVLYVINAMKLDIPPNVEHSNVSQISRNICDAKWRLFAERKFFSETFYSDFSNLNIETLRKIFSNENGFRERIQIQKLRANNKENLLFLLSVVKEEALINEIIVTYVNKINNKKNLVNIFKFCDNFTILNDLCDFNKLNTFLSYFVNDSAVKDSEKDKIKNNCLKNLKGREKIKRAHFLLLKLDSSNSDAIKTRIIKKEIQYSVEIFDKKFFQDKIFIFKDCPQLFLKYNDLLTSEIFEKQKTKTKKSLIHILSREMMQKYEKSFIKNKKSNKKFFDYESSEMPEYLKISFNYFLFLNNFPIRYTTVNNFQLFEKFYFSPTFIQKHYIENYDFVYKNIGKLKINTKSNFYDEDFYYFLRNSYKKTKNSSSYNKIYSLIPFNDKVRQKLENFSQILEKRKQFVLVDLINQILNRRSQKDVIVSDLSFKFDFLKNLKDKKIFLFKQIYNSLKNNNNLSLEENLIEEYERSLISADITPLSIDYFKKIHKIILNLQDKKIENSLKFSDLLKEIKKEFNLKKRREALCLFYKFASKSIQKSENKIVDAKNVLENFGILNLKFENFPLPKNKKIQNFLSRTITTTETLEKYNPNYISNINIEKISKFINLDFIIKDKNIYLDSKKVNKKISAKFFIEREKSYSAAFKRISKELSDEIRDNFGFCDKKETFETFEIVMGSFDKILKKIKYSSEYYENLFFRFFLQTIFSLKSFKLISFMEFYVNENFLPENKIYPDWYSYIHRSITRGANSYEVSLFAFIFPRLYKVINIPIYNEDVIYDECAKINLNNIASKILKSSEEYILYVKYYINNNKDLNLDGQDTLSIELIIPKDLAKRAHFRNFDSLLKNKNMKNNQNLFMAKLNHLLTTSNNFSAILDLWKINMDNKLLGVVECSICYLIVCSSDKSIPNSSCNLCYNKFHKICINSWMLKGRSGEGKLCPICRGNFYE